MHPLLSAAVKPLEKSPDLQQTASSLLAETTDPSHPSTTGTIARLEKINARRFPRWPLLGIAALLALVWSLSLYRMEWRFLPALSGDFFYMVDFLTNPPVEPRPDMTTEQRLLLGEPGKSPLEKAKRLYEAFPDNPAYYAEYIATYTSHNSDGENSKLPPGFFETVERIAPDNSFFYYWAAGRIGGDSYEKTKSNPDKRPEPRFHNSIRLSSLAVEKDYVITDQQSFDEALDLLEKASRLPHFDSYTNTMLVERSRLLPYENLTEYVVNMMVAFSSRTAMIGIRKVSEIFSAQAQVLSRQQEREKFIALSGQAEHFLRVQAQNPDIYLVNELVFVVNAAAISSHFHWAAERLGIVELSGKYKKWMDAFQEQRDQRDIRYKEESTWIRNHGSMFSHATLKMVERQVVTPPPLTDADLKPLRLVDHEVASRFGVTASALYLAFLCLPLFLDRFFRRKPVRITASHLSKLLTATDWAWITALGIILPLAVYLTINRITPLGARAFGIQAFFFHFPFIHFVCILLTLLIAPALLIHWRLSIRLAPFGIPCKSGILFPAVLASLLLWSLAAFPILSRTEMNSTIATIMISIPVLCMGILLFSLLRKPTHSIARAATTSALLPAYAAAIIALCLTTPIFLHSESHWIQQDTLFRINPDAPVLGAYEFRVAAQKRKETNSILGL